MALEYLFTGRCEMTDAAGRGAESLIRTGAKELEVSGPLKEGRQYAGGDAESHIVELDGNRVAVDAAEASLENALAQLSFVRCAECGPFIEMSEAEQKWLLAQVVDAGK